MLEEKLSIYNATFLLGLVSKEGFRHQAANERDMQADLAKRVADETNDVLASLWLVRDNEDLADRLFRRLVDLLLESSLVELAARMTTGAISRADYIEELGAIAAQCRTVGLLPASS